MSALSAIPFNSAEAIEVPAGELNRLLGYVGSDQPAGKEAELIEWVIDWYRKNGQPIVLSQRFVINEVDTHKQRVDLANGHRLTSKVLAERFDKSSVHEMIVFGVSAGDELTDKVAQLWDQDHPDKAYFLDIYGSAVTEQMARSLGLHFCQEAQLQKMALLPHYSPGYDGWDLADQALLLEMLNDQQADEPKITLTDGAMLRPAKSQLGVFGLSRDWSQAAQLHKYVPCQHCTLDGCVFRRAAYQPGAPEISCETVAAPSTKPMYAFAEKTLARWAGERLTIKTTGERLDAQFTWEGTTCGDMGRPLRMLYDIRLSPQADRYRILAKTCRPSDDDDSYRQMCAFKKLGTGFLQQIAEHNALLGRPLNEALDWDPEVLPAGCQCTQSIQDHKWKIVLQTLHYHLYHT